MSNLPIRQIDQTRREASERLNPATRSELGQFMTPTNVADFMAALFTRWPNYVRLLDPGAGIGSLTEAFAERFVTHAPTQATLESHCYEIDPMLIGYLTEQLADIKSKIAKDGYHFISAIHSRDFIQEACFQIGLGERRFTHAILNPPYKKIGNDSEHRKLLRLVGIETVNLYTAFLGLTIAMIEDGGEIIAIVPRSFCNGTYFRPFREYLLARTAITHIHVFESRKRAFKDDDVLQENIIVRLVRNGEQTDVVISSSLDPSFTDYEAREIPFSKIVKTGDKERFIHIPTLNESAPDHLFTHSLQELGLEVSTGPVVDFRLKDHWLSTPTGDFAPLLYAHHFQGGRLAWPKAHKKPNALVVNEETRKWLFPRGCYTLTKRFSSKEERRRLVAYVLDPKLLPFELYGFENHFNVFHSKKAGIPMQVAHGLALFLNSTVIDNHFRNFSGHTQVNATDLRALRFPSLPTLHRFGSWAMKQGDLNQEKIDEYIVQRYGE